MDTPWKLNSQQYFAKYKILQNISLYVWLVSFTKLEVSFKSTRYSESKGTLTEMKKLPLFLYVFFDFYVL